MSKTKALYHLVFSTKDREMTITPECKEKLYRYITTLTKEHGSVLYRVGGIANHVHMCIDLSPNVALAVFMQHIKSKTSFVIKHESWSEIFRGWGAGYYGCTISPGHAEALVEYIKNQEIHHNSTQFDGEIQWLFQRAGLSYYEDDLK